MNVILKRIEKNEMLVSSIINTYFLADQNSKLLSHLLGESKHLKRWDGSYAASGVNTLRFSLYMHVLSEMRAIMFDTHPKVASVHNVIKALDDLGFRVQLKKWFCDVSNFHVHSIDDSLSEQSIQYMRGEQAKIKESYFDELLLKSLDNYQKLCKSDLGTRVNDARNKMISHKEFQSTKHAGRRVLEPADFGLVYSDAADIVEEAHDIIFSLYSLFTKAHFDSRSSIRHHELVADEFWSK